MAAFKEGFSEQSRLQADLHQVQAELASAEAELASLTRELSAFEAEVDDRLGSLLDQLSMLDAEIRALTAEVKRMREDRLFGQHRAQYYGAGFTPYPTEEPPGKITPDTAVEPAESGTADPQTEFKTLYRRLARRYHPDLATSESDRASRTEQMTAINQAFSAGNLTALREMAGIASPPGADIILPAHQSPDSSLSAEIERTRRRLTTVQKQIAELHRLPNVQLSLEVKLARRQGRNLLAEMAADMQRKVAQKTAQRDYLKSQVEHSSI